MGGHIKTCITRILILLTFRGCRLNYVNWNEIPVYRILIPVYRAPRVDVDDVFTLGHSRVATSKPLAQPHAQKTVQMGMHKPHFCKKSAFQFTPHLIQFTAKNNQLYN